MNANEIRELLNSPKEPGLQFIADSKDYEKEVLSGYTMEVVKYGFDLDKFCPAKMGQLVCLIGHTNVGKTTAILWMMSKLIKRQKKLLIYSAENRISSLHKNLSRFYTGRPNVGIDDMESIRDSVRYIKHERQFSYNDILNQSTYLLDAGFDWDFLLIDPYNALRIDNRRGINSHEYHYEAIEQMRVFTITTNKSIFLNCHTVTEAQRVKPDANGHRPAPLDSDVEGGAKFTNKADDAIVIHRQISSTIEGEKFITELHVKKVRNQEFGGEPTPFDKPLKIKYRIDRSGFDVINSQPINDYKQVNFYEKDVTPF